MSRRCHHDWEFRWAGLELWQVFCTQCGMVTLSRYVAPA